jgi:hypothetical protein
MAVAGEAATHTKRLPGFVRASRRRRRGPLAALAGRQIPVAGPIRLPWEAGTMARTRELEIPNRGIVLASGWQTKSRPSCYLGSRFTWRNIACLHRQVDERLITIRLPTLDRELMNPPECRFSWVDIGSQSILEPVGISAALKGFRRPRNRLDWAKRCPRFSSTPVLFPPAH